MPGLMAEFHTTAASKEGEDLMTARMLALCVVLMVLAMPVRGLAQCGFEISVYADLFDYPEQGEADVWGSGLDWSPCLGGGCYHEYWIDVYAIYNQNGGGATGAPSQQAGFFFTATTEGWVTYGADLYVYCICAQTYGTVSYSDSTYLQRPQPQQCAVPTNFHQTSATSQPDGTLIFEYAWSSSVGSLSNLSACEVGEIVDYSSADIPWPVPFPPNSPPNPTILMVPGADGDAEDTHSTSGTFRTPYSAKTFSASQEYGFTCPCHQNNAWTRLMGPHDITRSVFNDNGQWKFLITKTGSAAYKNLP